MSVTSTVYLWLAYPSPVSTVALSSSLDAADQRLNLIDLGVAHPLALDRVDGCQEK